MTTIATLMNFPKLPELGAEFHRELVAVAGRTGHDPSLIAMVMYGESGFNPQAVNDSSGASGLIQIMPLYAADGARPVFKYTIEEIRAMTALQQLELVEQSYRMKGVLQRPVDYFLANFFPRAVGKPDDYVMGRKGDMTPISPGSRTTYNDVYVGNSGLDYNKDGVIDVGDTKIHTTKLLSRAAGRPPIVVTDGSAPVEPPPAVEPLSEPPSVPKSLRFLVGFFMGGVGFLVARLFGKGKK